MTNTKKLGFLLNSLKVLKPKLYKKMVYTGRLFEYLIKDNNFTDEEISDYIRASYLCNIGFLAIEESLFKKNSPIERKNIKKRHVKISNDYLKRTGFPELVEIVNHHHEYPNGLGYFGEMQTNKIIGYINIADEFIELTIEYFYCDQILTLNEAIGEIEKRYKNNSLYKDNEMREIKEKLTEYYEKVIINV